MMGCFWGWGSGGRGLLREFFFPLLEGSGMVEWSGVGVVSEMRRAAEELEDDGFGVTNRGLGKEEILTFLGTGKITN